MTLTELANDLDTTIFDLMEFAPDDITRDMDGDEQIDPGIENMIRSAWEEIGIPDAVAARVDAGMAFLDIHFPGHEHRINLDALRVSDGLYCPLAQASKRYYCEADQYLYAEKGINLRAVDDDGLSLAQHMGFIATDTWGGLDQAWKRAYRVRLDA